MNLNCKLYFILSLATENDELYPIGKIRSPQCRMFPDSRFCHMSVSYSAPIVLQMFQTPTLIVMTIAATRMHRSLTDFTYSGYYTSRLLCSVLLLSPGSECVSCFGTHPNRIRCMANTNSKLTFAAPIPLDRVEVTVHKSSEDHPPVNKCQLSSYGPFGADSHSQEVTHAEHQ